MKMVCLFDDSRRDGEERRTEGEPVYHYLARSGRAEVDRIRRLLNEWVADYPPTDAVELVGRMRTGDDEHWRSAFLELYTYKMLTRLGYSLEIHPPLEWTSTRPDFKATRKGSAIYVECVAVDGNTKEERTALARWNDALRTLQCIQNKDFFVGIDVDGAPATPVPAKKFKMEIETWLDTLTIAEVIATGGPMSQLKLRLQHDGLTLFVRPLLRAEESLAQPQRRAIGYQMDARPQIVKPAEMLSKALKTKANRYGQLDLPFLLVCSVKSSFLDRDDVVETLLGRTQLRISAADHGRNAYQRVRANDGLWWSTATASPRMTTMSGLLLLRNLREWSIATTRPELHLHPAPRHPLERSWMPFDTTRYMVPLVDDAALAKETISTDGMTATDLWELPNTWPQD